MNKADKDILSEIPWKEIKILRLLYKAHRRAAPHVYSFLKTAENWKTKKPNETYITIYAVHGNWQTDGTLIAHLTFSCYDFFVFTLDPKCRRLFQGLMQTRRFQWKNHHCLFYAVHEVHAKVVKHAMKKLDVPVYFSSTTNLWRVGEMEALIYKNRAIPDKFYMDKIKPSDVTTIDECWPSRFKGSEKYLRKFIEMNGGYGIYRKDNGELVSWVLKNVLGQLGVLQTKTGYMQMGLGLAVTLQMARDIAREGHDPIGTVHEGNRPSEILFSKIGFEKLYRCYYIDVGKELEES